MCYRCAQRAVPPKPGHPVTPRLFSRQVCWTDVPACRVSRRGATLLGATSSPTSSRRAGPTGALLRGRGTRPRPPRSRCRSKSRGVGLAGWARASWSRQAWRRSVSEAHRALCVAWQLANPNFVLMAFPRHRPTWPCGHFVLPQWARAGRTAGLAGLVSVPQLLPGPGQPTAAYQGR